MPEPTMKTIATPTKRPAELMNAMLGAGDPDLNPEGPESVVDNEIPKLFEGVQKLIAARREKPTDDLTSLLVHAEIDGHQLTDETMRRRLGNPGTPSHLADRELDLAGGEQLKQTQTASERR